MRLKVGFPLLDHVLMLSLLRVLRVLRLLQMLAEAGLANLLLVMTGGRRVAVVKGLLVFRWFPVDRQLRHDRLLHVAVGVMAQAVIRHHVLGLGVLLIGLVPREKVDNDNKKK